MTDFVSVWVARDPTGDCAVFSSPEKAWEFVKNQRRLGDYSWVTCEFPVDQENETEPRT